MEAEEGASVAKRARGRGRGRSRGRGRGRGGTAGGRGRAKKAAVQVIQSDEEDLGTDGLEAVEEEPMDIQNENQQPPEIDLEADISQLEAPTFSTIDRGPPEPMLRLHWDHRVNLIGEKVLNPMIHCCDKCLKPILIYGRMIPCKHVFCLACAKKEDKVCPRCGEKVTRVEQTGLGTVFMCTHGGTRYGNTGCRRTYLSQRDLQAHINHRHLRGLPPQQLPPTSNADTHPHSHLPPNLSHTHKPLLDMSDKERGGPIPSPGNLPPHSADPRTGGVGHPQHPTHTPHPQHPHPHTHPPFSRRSSGPPPTPSPAPYSQAAPIPVMTSRTNLITVPIHDSAASSSSTSSSSSGGSIVSSSTAPHPPPPVPYYPSPPPPYYSPSQPPPPAYPTPPPQYYPYRSVPSSTPTTQPQPMPPTQQPPPPRPPQYDPGHPPYPPPPPNSAQWPPPSHHPHQHPPHPPYYR